MNKALDTAITVAGIATITIVTVRFADHVADATFRAMTDRRNLRRAAKAAKTVPASN